MDTTRNLHIWRNFRLELPAQWEMLQYSLNRREGRCAFADRYYIRLEFNWKQLDAKPDLERSITDYLAKLQQEQNMEDAARTGTEAWPGIRGHQGSLFTTRFLRYFTEERCVVQAVFLWPGGHDKVLEQDILNSVDPEPARESRYQHWKAFGLDILTPRHFTLQQCTVEPAHARLTFGDPGTPGREEKFQRLGMVSTWLSGSVKDWLKSRVPDNLVLDPPAASQHNGHRIDILQGSCPATGLARLRGKKRHYTAAAWICPADRRLYCLTAWIGDDQRPDPEHESLRLSCCHNHTCRN